MTGESSNILKTFGSQVRAKRTSLGLSQEQLAFETGLDRTYISGVERGVRNPSLIILEKIAKGLKVSLPELFSFNLS